MRKPTEKEEPKKEPTAAEAVAEAEQGASLVEREINLTLINDKLNYIISTVNRIAEACEIDLSK